MTRIASKPARSEPLATAPMSYEDFLVWDGENEHVEWVNGEIVPVAQIDEAHDRVTGFLIAIFKFLIEEHDAGEIRSDPFQMKTGPKLPGRAPDLQFIAKKNASRLKRLYVDGPADLVIEVISPGSRATDRGVKFYEYEQGGVREYWLIDPERKQAEFYRRGRDGIFKAVEPDANGEFHSTVLKGMWIKVAWLWQRPSPKLRSIYQAWGLL
jgi:Uma2 family endonuclease